MENHNARGIALKILRIRAGLSQQAVADKLGVNLRTIQGYEGGSTFPRANRLPDLLEIVGASMDGLRGEYTRTLERVAS